MKIAISQNYSPVRGSNPIGSLNSSQGNSTSELGQIPTRSALGQLGNVDALDSMLTQMLSGQAPTSAAAPAQSTTQHSAADRQGQQAVDQARSYRGRTSRSLRGVLPNFSAPGGQSNNCAAFVTANLKNAGRINWTEAGVSNGNLERRLRADGWHQVPAAQAQPGDVWLANSRKHTELVSQAGGTRTIGSNNVRQGLQVISEHAKNPNSGVYYHKDQPK